MAREFIRLKVGTYRRKAFGTDHRPAYPAAAIVAFYGVLELAGEQPEPGRFESERLVRVLLEGRGQGKPYARQVPFLIVNGDLVRLADGRVYVDGWDEMQTGDYTVADRVARFRERHANVPSNAPGNGRANDDVPHASTGAPSPSSSTSPSPSVAPPRAPAKPNGHGPLAGVLTDLLAGKPNGVDYGIGEGESKVFAYLARAGAAIRPDSGLGRRLLGLIERRGYDAVLERAAKLASNGAMSDRQWVFGLEEALEKPPSGADARAADREVDQGKRQRRVYEQIATRRLEQFRWTGRWDPAYGPEPRWNPAWGARP